LQPMAHSRHCIRVATGVRGIATAVSYVAYFVNTCRISHCGYFLPFLADSRFTLYAIATACLTGLPAFTSALMFLRNAEPLGDLTNGTLAFLWCWRWLHCHSCADDLWRFGWASTGCACRTFLRHNLHGCHFAGWVTVSYCGFFSLYSTDFVQASGIFVSWHD